MKTRAITRRPKSTPSILLLIPMVMATAVITAAIAVVIMCHPAITQRRPTITGRPLAWGIALGQDGGRPLGRVCARHQALASVRRVPAIGLGRAVQMARGPALGTTLASPISILAGVPANERVAVAGLPGEQLGVSTRRDRPVGGAPPKPC